jgi:hypothetical protein
MLHVKTKWFLLAVVAAIVLVTFTILRFFNSVSERSTVDVSIYALYVLGGAVLTIVPFDRDHQRSDWARGLFALAAVLLLFIGASELLRHYGIWVLSSQIEHGFAHTLAVLRGVVLGFLLALVFSGELVGRKIVRRENA